mgnify:CR=1 FL=1
MKIYDLQPIPYLAYIKHDKKNEACTTEIVKRKLSAIIETVSQNVKNFDKERNLDIYTIGKLKIIAVNNIHPFIIDLYWDENNNSDIPDSLINKLKKEYDKYGLTEDGNFLKY